MWATKICGYNKKITYKIRQKNLGYKIQENNI